MHTNKMDDYSVALNAHVNILFTSYNKNPEYYAKGWEVWFEDFHYQVSMFNISAVFIIDYMRKRGLDTFLKFTLHHEQRERAMRYWLIMSS
jgi:hypothetical protein